MQVVFFPQVSQPNPYTYFSLLPVPAESPTHSFVLELIIRIIFGDDYKW
jgi:hypothetical protein